MRRGVVIALGILSVVAVVLAVALATVGTKLDEQRLESADLQYELDDLQSQVDSLMQERDELRLQVNAHEKAAESLKASLGSATAPEAVATAAPETAAVSATTAP